MLKTQRADILTPANAITSLGLMMVAAGSFRLNTPIGFWLVGIGKFMDVIDGFVARRTHTSNFGAVFDITVDKITMLMIVIAAFYFHLVPAAFLIFLVLYHGLISMMATDAMLHKFEADPSKLGKLTMALHTAAMLLFIYAAVMEPARHFVHAMAVVLAIAGVLIGFVTFTRYTQDYIKRVFLPYHR